MSGQDRAGHDGDKGHVVVRPGAVKWGPAPPSLPPGAQLAVLSGDPGKPGVPYVFRAKLPDGYKVPPHWHPADEHVTIIEGTVAFGMGDRLDEAAGKDLPAGGFFYMPAQHRHWALARTDAVIQIHAKGPWAVNYVNPADDPRWAKEAVGH